ncbi:hypothetical protein GOP47_0014873 [Adiantum capillus-veneris]|uniref:Uncharacterized protein n=1 Tax=Adiantum capillus-veneris TaxID=13818 RepID=A0A9D4UMB0_ADICA|nr:hypothetical protein GOP47_0014873 [Adiantum capillus-veneris]
MQQFLPLNVRYLNCQRNTSSGSLSTTFTRNLNNALHNFTALTSQGSKYAISTATGSSGQDNLYAVFQCRGDLSTQSCTECVQNVTTSLPEACPEAVGAQVRLEGCLLRYDNQSFFGLDTSSIIYACNPYNTSDAVTLRLIGDLVDNVTNEAPKRGGWASASASGLYAAAQCLGYLDEAECSQCLLSYSYRVACDSRLGGQVYLPSCNYRYEAYNFMEAAGAAAVPPLSSAPSLSPVSLPSPGSKKTLIVAVSVVAGVVLLIGAVCVVLVWCYKASKLRGVKRVDKPLSWPRDLLQNKAQVFSLEELEEATGHFNPINKLGEGGFGIVYKGTLSTGESVAIKKLSIGSQQGKQEFLNEVNLITSVQHKNLIRLLGCCAEGPERILVYEYLPNKSLDFFLSGMRTGRMLNWSTRYGIVVGMAKGLAYLHEESHVRIIHRDIKPSNILLDDHLNPVIADFGLARLMKDNVTQVNTAVAGTMGYLAPEYALRGALSEKVDVFSFGLVSLEIITGKRNAHSMLLTWVWENYQQENVLDLVDETLDNAFSPEQVTRVVHVALLCTQENPKQRPTMSTVALWLSGASDILEIPSKPTFLDYNVSTPSMGESNFRITLASPNSSQSTHDFRREVSRIAGGVQSLSEIVEPRSKIDHRRLVQL